MATTIEIPDDLAAMLKYEFVDHDDAPYNSLKEYIDDGILGNIGPAAAERDSRPSTQWGYKAEGLDQIYQWLDAKGYRDYEMGERLLEFDQGEMPSDIKPEDYPEVTRNVPSSSDEDE